MLRYRLYIIGAFYLLVILISIAIFNSRGCYSLSPEDKSMSTLQSNKFYFISKKSTSIDALDRGYIILYNELDTPDIEKVGKIVAMPGDLIEIREGRFFLNGDEKPFADGAKAAEENTSFLPSISLPKNVLYILPDDLNQVDFSDKKYFVHANQIRGKFLQSFFKDEAR